AASAGPDRIVITVAEKGRPSDLSEALAPIEAALAKRGYVQGAALVNMVEGTMSREGGALSASDVVEAQRGVERAYDKFINGSYPEALSGAKAVLQLYSRAHGQLAREAALRELRYRALIIASRSADVTADGESAFALMAEMIRSFPDRPVSGTQFDPSVIALYRRVREELVRQGTGMVEVRVDDPNAAVWIDEQFAGT